MNIVRSDLCWLVTLDNSNEINTCILNEYQISHQNNDLKQTHFFGGRYENIYISSSKIPSLKAILEQTKKYASVILNIDETQLKTGFWFNEMHAGHETTLHSHDDDDELLSAVYYIKVPNESGQLILRASDTTQTIMPEEGQLILFKPNLPHAVSENKSNEMRLSIGINIGPKNP